MENDNHEEYGNPRNTGRRGLQVEAKTKSLPWPHSTGTRGPHSPNTKKGPKRPTLAWNEMSFVTVREVTGAGQGGHMGGQGGHEGGLGRSQGRPGRSQGRVREVTGAGQGGHRGRSGRSQG